MKLVNKNGDPSLCHLFESFNLRIGVSQLPIYALLAIVEFISTSTGISQLQEEYSTRDPGSPIDPSPFTDQPAFDDTAAAVVSTLELQLNLSQAQILFVFLVFCCRSLARSPQSLYDRFQQFTPAATPFTDAKALATETDVTKEESDANANAIASGNPRSRWNLFQNIDNGLLDIALYSVIVTGTILPQRLSLFTSPCRPFTTKLPQCQDFVHSPATYLASAWLVLGLILLLDHNVGWIIRILNRMNQGDQNGTKNPGER
jgi:hypothetical protein